MECVWLGVYILDDKGNVIVYPKETKKKKKKGNVIKTSTAMCSRGVFLLGMVDATAFCAIRAISFTHETGIWEAFSEIDVQQVLKALLMPKLDSSSLVIYNAFCAYLIRE